MRPATATATATATITATATANALVTATAISTAQKNIFQRFCGFFSFYYFLNCFNLILLISFKVLNLAAQYYLFLICAVGTAT